MARLPFVSGSLEAGKFYPLLCLSRCSHRSVSPSSLFLPKSFPRAPLSHLLPLRSLSANGASHSNGLAVGDFEHVNKQVISVTPQLYNYILANVREPEILRELREETAAMRGSQMQVSPDQAALIVMLVRIHGARRCIEVGVYTGYSSLAVALVLPESGVLVACERDERSLEVARKYYQRAGVSHKVDVKQGLAEDTLESMILNGEVESYDFAFVDAEKRMYPEYFELLLKLVRPGGIIVIDNVLWYGKVADLSVDDSKTVSIRKFNQSIFEDKRITTSIVPIGDGMTICRKNDLDEVAS
ncbi:hypothetical protein H6P81_008281 [Aristolochia fimbriata]|uniref:Caffeoyl-CoA O-methyltransferase n=1 Tax=Aristolochia fimbriata TaxID=158543 RepID=A0AAV7F2R3_ARIFI|nr:hypothetical protein H6P81_008281 [Aristolochia fimbriata]